MEATIRLKRELAYTGTILKVYRDRVIANGIEETYDYIHHDGAAAVSLPVTKEGKILMVRQYRNALDRLRWKFRRESWTIRKSPKKSALTVNWRRRPAIGARIWNT